MRDYKNMPKVKIIEESDIGDAAVFWFCMGVLAAAIGVYIWETLK